jgi:hypothetical protein
MGHHIRAFTDQSLKVEIACLRLFPSEAFVTGNIYDVLQATEFRRSCSGSVGTVEVQSSDTFNYPVKPNRHSEKFLDEIHYNNDRLVDGRVYVSFM